MPKIDVVLSRYVVASGAVIKHLEYDQGDWGISGALDFTVETKFGTLIYSGSITGEDYYYHSYFSIDVNNTGSIIELDHNDLGKHHPGGTNTTLDNIVLLILDVVEKKFPSWPYGDNDLADTYYDDGFDEDEAERMAQEDVNRTRERLAISKRDARRNILRAISMIERIYDQNPDDIDGIYGT